MDAIIYALCHPITGEIRYVGKTIMLTVRIRGHINEKATTRKGRWIQSILRTGLRPFIEIIESVDEDHWQEAERFWISYLRFLGCRLTNACDGGVAGNRLSEEAKRKVSASQKGRRKSLEHRAKLSTANKGKKLSDETKRKISIKSSGRPCSERCKETVRNRYLGKTLSADHRQKLSVSHKGQKPAPWAIANSIAVNTGAKRSKATCRRISEAKQSAENRMATSAGVIAFHAAKRESLGLPPLTEDQIRIRARKAAATRRSRARRIAKLEHANGITISTRLSTLR